MSRKRLRNGEMHDGTDGQDDTVEEEQTYVPRVRPEKLYLSPHTFPESRETCTCPAPITTDDVCERLRNSIDYSKKITRREFMDGTASRPVRIYADGIYDMFHSGHARQLMQAKRSFPNVYLLIGVCNDELTHRRKGRTVMNQAERYEAVRHCRYVDELIIDAPWELSDEFLGKHKIDFVAHDDLPYGAGDEEDIYKFIKDRDMFVVTERTEGVSTTDVISRIIKDYDLYVRRNLARGYTAKELNVSFMKEKKIQFQEKVDLMKGKIADKRHEVLNKWEEMSRDFITNFTDLFGRDGRINQWINVSRLKVAKAISPPASPSASTSRTPSPVNFNDGTSPPYKRQRLDAQFTEEDDEEEDEQEQLEEQYAQEEGEISY